jgi:hypothetical protein
VPRGFAASKKDLSQPAIEAAFEVAGWSVCDTHAMGERAPDLFVAKRGMTIAIECKTGKAKRMEHQVAWAEDWRGAYLWGSDPLVLLEQAEALLQEKE